MESESKNKFLHVKEGDLGKLEEGVVGNDTPSTEESIMESLKRQLSNPELKKYTGDNTQEKIMENIKKSNAR